MEGYKVFEPDWTCRGFQYEAGKTFEEDVTPSCCNRGFHFCKELKDCFNYYPFNPDNKVAKVIALGEIDEESDDSKCCTNKIQIVEEISWEDVLRMVNLGKGNAGLCNSGDWNSGDWNSGNRNSGNWNSGNRNSGDWNSGNRNSGNWNSGNRNSGDWNSGNRNSGNWNSGNRNSGDWNSGNRNSGDWNSGNRNSGNWNSGNRNSGDWNNTNFSNGCFNTQEPKILLFNKPSDWTYRDWLNSDARYILNQIPRNVVEWVYSSDMTEEEKKSYPSYETTGGYLKILDEKDCSQIWWDGLSSEYRNIIVSLPNFNAEIFEKCTGIKI
jgi:hypothetical protein